MDISLLVRRLIGLELERHLEDIGSEQSLIKELKLDNADLFSLVLDIEEVFGMEIPNEIVDKFRTVKDIIDYIQQIPKEANWEDRAKEFIISYDQATRKQIKEVLRGFDIIVERYYWRANWKYKKFREKFWDCISRLYYNPRRFYYRTYSPGEEKLRRTFNQKLEEIKKRPYEQRYTGLCGYPGSYEEAFVLKAENYSKKLVKKILKRKVPLKSIIPEIESAALRLWYVYGQYLRKDFSDMMEEQLDLIREEIRKNKYIPGWDEDLTDELVIMIKRAVGKLPSQSAE